MKKLLLLLMAFLLFAPPRAKAEKKTMVFMQAYGTTSTKCTVNWTAQEGQSNGPIQYTLATKPTVWVDLTSAYTTSTTAGTAWAAMRRYDSEGKDYIKIETDVTTTGTTKSSGLYYVAQSGQTSMAYYKSARGVSGKRLTFSTFCSDGKIHSVKITFYGSATSPVALTDNVECPQGINGAASKVWTFKSIDPSKPFTITPGSNLSGNSGNNACMVKIEIEWEPGVLEPSPEMPEVSLRGGNYDYTYDTETETITFPTFPLTYKQILVKSAPACADKVYYTFDSSAPLPVNSSTLNGWTELTLGDAQTKATGVAFGSDLIPSNDAALGDGKTYNLRLIGYNNDLDKFGAEDKVKSITCKLVRLKAPAVDISKTQGVPGQTYNEETNTIEYTGVNPIVYFTNPNVLMAKTYYTTDGTNPSSSSKYSSSGSTTVSITNFPEGFTDDQIPPVGTYNQIKILTSLEADASNNEKVYSYYDENKGEPVIVHVRRVGEGATTPTLAAPQVSVDFKTVTLSGNVKGYIQDKDATITLSHQKIGNDDDEATGIMQYQWADASNGVWAQTPDETLWKTATDGKYNVTGTGRLFVREYKEGYDCRTAYYDFNKIAVEKVRSLKYSDLLGIDDAATAITMTEPVRLIGSFPLSDQTTSSSNVYLLFV
ncbi:MAG: hypothetical protein K2H50_00910, partial [Paramuribaculum sp.]|nr:hypothetical protein [Paramuribaculum sp.]